MKRITALLILCAFAVNVGTPSIAQAQAATVAGEFVSRLPIGTNTKLRLEDGRKIKATLMTIETDAVVVSEIRGFPSLRSESSSVGSSMLISIEEGRIWGEPLRLARPLAPGPRLVCSFCSWQFIRIKRKDSRPLFLHVACYSPQTAAWGS